MPVLLIYSNRHHQDSFLMSYLTTKSKDLLANFNGWREGLSIKIKNNKDRGLTARKET